MAWPGETERRALDRDTADDCSRRVEMKHSTGERWPPEIRVPLSRRSVRRGRDFALGMGVAFLLAVVIGVVLYTLSSSTKWSLWLQ